MLDVLGALETLAGTADPARARAAARGRHPALARRHRPGAVGARPGRPTRSFARRHGRHLGVVPGALVSSARRIMVGPVPVGGGAPVAVQSMTCTRTGDADATLAQVRALVAAGCEIVRVSLPTAEEAPAFARIVREAPALARRLRGPGHRRHPLRLAPRAGRRSRPGAAGIRINPGTMAEKHVREIVRAGEARVPAGGGARAAGSPDGSAPGGARRRPHRRERRLAAARPARPRRARAGARRSSRRRCAGRRSSTTGASTTYKLSVKSSSVPVTIAAYRLLARALGRAAARRRHRGGHGVERHASRAPSASGRCWPTASATRCACRSPATPSKRCGSPGRSWPRWTCGGAART